MQQATFGHRLNLPRYGSSFVKLKKQGDKIRFIIANTPHYETHHWIGPREKVLCGRYNTEEKNAPCQWCDEWRKLQDAGDVDGAKDIAPVVTFYYPVLDVTNEVPEAVIFTTTPKVHWIISSYEDEGADVWGSLWIVTRTQEPSHYYDVKNMGVRKLSDEEEKVLARAKNIKLTAVRKSSSVVVAPDEQQGDE